MNAFALVALIAANSAHYCGVDVPWDLFIGNGDEALIRESGQDYVCGNESGTITCENGAILHVEIVEGDAVVSFVNQPINPPIVLPRCDYVPI